jgi:DNA-binding MarR family transcriptional regulator
VTAESTLHPRHEFDDLLNSLEVIDWVLSKQATSLETAGYVRIRKGHVGKRPRTWLSMTADGRAAFLRHVAALRAVLGEE